MRDKQPEPNYEGFALAILDDARESKRYWEAWRNNHMVVQPNPLLSRADAELVLKYARTNRLIDKDEEETQRIMGGHR